jgi:hypothetical protein
MGAGTKAKSALTYKVLNHKFAFLPYHALPPKFAGRFKVQAHWPQPERLAHPAVSLNKPGSQPQRLGFDPFP